MSFLPTLIRTVILAAGIALPAAAADQPVTARLVADAAMPTPGAPFLLGVEFTMEEGWHLYWRNPGDAGLAPTIAFTLPAGWTMGETRWPAPERVIDPGDIVLNVYHHRVLIAAEATPPADWTPAPVTITATASWLMCKAELCMPGKASLALALPQAEPLAAEAVAAWRASLPQPAEGFAEIRRDAGAASITLLWKRPVEPASLVAFAPAGGALAWSDHAERASTLTVAKPGDEPSSPAVVTGRTGDGHPFAIAVPLSSP
ncbi:MAG TPA: protein-disulfide reductase DsbD domain-containing protein [Planctomycetota bacterium]|nr:protein-disulfide reductase DsbD domain-containing protein [Planctomycetota bacterium]